MKKAPAALVGVLLLLVLTACGGGGSGLSAKVKTGPYAGLTKEGSLVAGAIATAIVRPDGGMLDQAAAECVAKKVVADVGVAGLRTAGTVSATNVYAANGVNVNATTSAAYTKALLGCVDQSAAVATIRANLVKDTSGGEMSPTSLRCYVNKVVDTIDLAHLMSAKLVTDAGELSPATQADAKTAASVTDAILGCADYFALQTAGVKKQKLPGFKPAVYQRCLETKIPKPTIRAFLIAIQANTPDVESLSKSIGATTAGCQASALPPAKKTKKK
ncbi:MAG: hypothetical protein JWQ74_959 [Marmoricola sp.]|nr:hypothetical protein [Marmoricola sp.]